MDATKREIEQDDAIMMDITTAIDVAKEVAPVSGGKKRRGGVKRKIRASDEDEGEASFSFDIPPASESVYEPAPEAAPEPAPVGQTSLPQTKQEVSKIKSYLTETIPAEVDSLLAKVLRKAPSVAVTAATGMAISKTILTPGIFSGITQVVGNLVASIPSPTWQEVAQSYGSIISSLTGFTGDVASWLQTPAGVLFLTSMIIRHRAASNNMSVVDQLKADASKLSGMATSKVKDASVKVVETVKKEVETGKNVFGEITKKRRLSQGAIALGSIPGVKAVREQKEAASALLGLSGTTGGRRRKTKKVKKSKRRATRRSIFSY